MAPKTVSGKYASNFGGSATMLYCGFPKMANRSPKVMLPEIGKFRWFTSLAPYLFKSTNAFNSLDSIAPADDPPH
jgi:hypothetical protein